MMRTAIVYSEKMQEYDLGHVLTGERYERFMRLFQNKLGRNPGFEIVEPGYATDADLRLVHGEEYIRRVERCESRDPRDTPLSPGVVRAARLLAGAGKLAGELVQSGAFNKAVVIGGGVQHAGRDYEKGFGIFSDVGVCAQNLMQNYGLQRVMVLDADAHAGDGIYSIFADDPRVLFVSIHQDTRTLYPGPGYANPVGEGEGRGYSVNVPLPPGTGDEGYEYVLDSVFSPLAEEFQPEIILMVDGSDTHFSDRITRMGLTLDGIYLIGNRVKQSADLLCQGKAVAFDGSGYDPRGVLFPIGWLASICGLTGIEMEFEEPYPLPSEYGGGSALAEVKRAVQAVRARLAPYWKCFSS
ncbi:MAG: histone deacetylase family protein [Chloroflexota bacterium]